MLAAGSSTAAAAGGSGGHQCVATDGCELAASSQANLFDTAAVTLASQIAREQAALDAAVFAPPGDRVAPLPDLVLGKSKAFAPLKRMCAS